MNERMLTNPAKVINPRLRDELPAGIIVEARVAK
jgi:hypothetical protein